MHRRQRIALLVFAVPAVVALALMVRGFFDPGGQWQPWRVLTAEREDGAWAAVSIDGRAVSWSDYRLALADGKVAGGRDGCNDWGYTDEAPGPNGGRAILSTLQACPEDAVRRAYWSLRHNPRLELRPDGLLRVTAGRHEGIFRRCRWRTERSSTKHSFSETRVCRPE